MQIWNYSQVGDDLWGDRYINNLKEINVDAGYVLKTLNTTSGIAQITVSEDGKNQIVIVPGANSLLTIKDVEDAKETISSADVVACQLETPPEVAIKTLELCKGVSGVKFFFMKPIKKYMFLFLDIYFKRSSCNFICRSKIIYTAQYILRERIWSFNFYWTSGGEYRVNIISDFYYNQKNQSCLYVFVLGKQRSPQKL